MQFRSKRYVQYRPNPKTQSGEHVLNHADYTAPTRNHELDHTDHTDHTDQDCVCPAWQIEAMNCRNEL